MKYEGGREMEGDGDLKAESGERRAERKSRKYEGGRMREVEGGGRGGRGGVTAKAGLLAPIDQEACR
jgi:hypothetical protein